MFWEYYFMIWSINMTNYFKTVCVCPPDAFGAKTHKVAEGKQVTLSTGETEIQGEDNILWTFGDERMLLAKIHLDDDIFETYDSDDGRFKGRLDLERSTGSLIIQNTRSSHSGVYYMKITKNTATVYKNFIVIVGDGGE